MQGASLGEAWVSLWAGGHMGAAQLLGGLTPLQIQREDLLE